MTPIEIFLLALALSADAFSVALAVGLRWASRRHVFRLSWHFGLFQALMPAVGALGGGLLLREFGDVDHVVACGVLELLGIRMLWQSLKEPGRAFEAADPTRGWSLVGLSLATSLDAFGAGIGLALARADLWASCLAIGATAGLLTMLGMFLGSRIQRFVGPWAGALGGLVLAGLGIRMLWI